MPIKPSPANILDGENNPIQCDCVYRIKGNQFQTTIREIYQKHGNTVQLLPISGSSAGGGVFQQSGIDNADIVGIQFTATPDAMSSIETNADILDVSLDQIMINPQSREIYAGSAITLEQLNQALATHLGERFKVLGADLTSYTYAQVGSTFMTGGMGPQRRYFSDSVKEIALFNGEKIQKVTGDSLLGYAGTYGWTGIVTAVCCQYCELPENEIAFAMPVNNSPDSLANLLAHFTDRTFLQIHDGKLLSESGESDCILGIEHITANAMGPMLSDGGNSSVHHRARQLQKKCQLAGADGLVFINGRSNQDIESFLFSMVDDAGADIPTISGIALEHTEVFHAGDEMRAVREAVPAAARGQAPKGKYSFKGHTDANIRLNPMRTHEAMLILWQANMDYVFAVNRCLETYPNVRGEILVYGHLNPYGVDPHNRITLASENQNDCNQVTREISRLTNIFFQTLDSMCTDTDSRFVGGEKGAASEYEISEAFDSIDQFPEAMSTKLIAQKKQISLTHHQFNWRALPLYR